MCINVYLGLSRQYIPLQRWQPFHSSVQMDQSAKPLEVWHQLQNSLQQISILKFNNACTVDHQHLIFFILYSGTFE